VAAYVVNVGNDVNGWRRPGGFDKEDALVLKAEAVAMIIADKIDGGNDGINSLTPKSVLRFLATSQDAIIDQNA